MTTERIDVLAELAAASAALNQHVTYPADVKFALARIAEARAAVAELIEALRAYDRWNYEAQSARVNGESVYSFAELQEMREKASAMGYAALARVGGA